MLALLMLRLCLLLCCAASAVNDYGADWHYCHRHQLMLQRLPQLCAYS